MPDLNDIPAALFCTVLFFALLAAIEFGHWLGRRLSASTWEDVSSPFLSLTGASMGLLGLLLAFSFNMGLTRYEARKVVILKEANTLSAALARSDLLQPEAAQRVKTLLREYVDSRLAYHGAMAESPQAEQLFNDAQAIHARLWSVVSAAANYREPVSANFSALTSAATDMTAARNERRYAIDNQIPSSVITLLVFVTLLATAMSGLAFGANRRRIWLALLGFPLVISLVIYTILDLDRPTRGWILVDQTPMLDVKASLR
jgi:hypothetical protein